MVRFSSLNCTEKEPHWRIIAYKHTKFSVPFCVVLRKMGSIFFSFCPFIRRNYFQFIIKSEEILHLVFLHIRCLFQITLCVSTPEKNQSINKMYLRFIFIPCIYCLKLELKSIWSNTSFDTTE